MAVKKRDYSSGNHETKLEVRAKLLEPERSDKLPRAKAYAYSSGSRLLAAAELDETGSTTLVLPAAREARSVRVLVGPTVDDEEPRISELLRRGAEERRLRLEPDQPGISLELTIVANTWLCWLLSLCFVPGTLMKRTEIDGISIDLPVCGAEVEVYEVDPIYILVNRLTTDVLERIRKFVLEPEPVSGPSPPDAGLSELKIAAQAESDLQLRQTLVRFPEFTRLALCQVHPFGLTMDLVATATTDECGNFQAVFFRGCNNPDTPDLYFKAKQSWHIGDVTIYEPTPVSCFVRWNYECGSEVNLFTSSPWARTCNPCPPIDPPEPGLNWVAVLHVGNTPLSRIRGTSPNAAIQSSTDAGNTGLSFWNTAEATNAASFDGRPFGGLLRPHIEFDNSLRDDLGVRYYRVSWRQGESGDFQPLTGEVHRHYSHEPPGATSPVFEVYSLGPQVVGTTPDLFEIPPALPPQGQWVVTDLAEDRTSAKFPTDAAAPPAEHGKYQLKIDLFDAAGNLVDVDGLNIVYVVPEQLDLAADAPVTTADAAGLGLVVDDDGDSNRSFLMTVHVDNNECSATIEPAMLAAPANSCGVIEYDPTSPGASVSMPYTASHPNGFATYRFRLKRGVTDLPPFEQTGTATPPGSFSQSATVAALTGAYPDLGLPSCPMAAFSEDLEVYALATDGWSRLWAYDDDDHAAFVLAPQAAP